MERPREACSLKQFPTHPPLLLALAGKPEMLDAETHQELVNLSHDRDPTARHPPPLVNLEVELSLEDVSPKAAAE